MSFNFNEMIHEERSNCLRSLPPFSGTVLSAGCAGAWYFDWFSQCTKHNGRHIGLELYSPKPADLAPNVEWIANSVENMEAIVSSSIDLVFSGQNIEHLSASSLSGFMTECSRVIKPGGLLIIDSPNRSVTEHLGYMQPEHTLELTVDEIISMLDLAGFEVLEARGIWLVVDPVSHRRMQIGACASGELSWVERQAGARTNPESSFIWWLNARKVKDVDPAAVKAFAEDLYWKYYKGFVSARFNNVVGTKRSNWGSTVVDVRHTDSGYTLYGPYIPLVAGKYAANFILFADAASGHRDFEIVLDIVSSVGTLTHGKRTIARTDFHVLNEWQSFQVPFRLDTYISGLETRCFVRGFDGSVLGNADILSLKG